MIDKIVPQKGLFIFLKCIVGFSVQRIVQPPLQSILERFHILYVLQIQVSLQIYEHFHYYKKKPF